MKPSLNCETGFFSFLKLKLIPQFSSYGGPNVLQLRGAYPLGSFPGEKA